MEENDIPFRASSLGRPYDHLDRLPAVFLLEDVRSLYNVGDSLNVATAAGVVAYELLRRCRRSDGGS